MPTMEGKTNTKRKSRVPEGRTGPRMVMDELLKRGFDAKLADRPTKKYDLLIGLSNSLPRPVHVRTVHVGPWYVSRSQFARIVENDVTVYVLLGIEKDPKRARFFVTRNSNLETDIRQPPNWRKFGFIDLEAVEQYEDNWDLLKT